MTTIQIFDPALCCSAGVCGVEVDQEMARFAADVDWVRRNGARIERFRYAKRMALAPLQAEEPVGVDRLYALAAGVPPRIERV